MKVAIIGSAFSGNKGAAAMLVSSIERLGDRHPDATFAHLSMYPVSDSRQNPYPNVTVMNASPLRLGVAINGGALAWRILPFLRPLVRRIVPEVGALADADVLLDEGGVTFVDGRGKFLIYNIASVLPAVFVRTPVVKIAQALGPFEQRTNRFWAKRILPRMAAIISRGAITHEHLTGLGLTNVTAGADLSFTLEVTAADERRADQAVDAEFFASGNVVGVSPSQVLSASISDAGRDYVAEVVAQIDHITETMGRPVFLVAHSARQSDKLHNNDLPVCRAIFARVANPDSVLFPDAELDPKVLRALIGRCDLFVASRFHAMVSSLAMKVPTFVIGWSHKYREVLEMFDLADWATSGTELSVASFREHIADLDGKKVEIRSQLSAHLPGVVQMALTQLDVVGHTAGSR